MSPYEILGVSSLASPEEIKSAYRKLAMMYHPDSKSSFANSEKFIKISEAYKSIISGNTNNIGFTLNETIIISVRESILGFNKLYNINNSIKCDCNSLGIKCIKCNGTKYLKKGFTMKTKCDRCSGYGFENPNHCEYCHGSGIKSIIESIKLTSNSIINDGDVITYKYSKGDLNIEYFIKKSDDDIYDRDGNNLIYNARISPLDQILGTVLYIPLFNHDSFKFQVKENIRIPSYFKIKNYGVPGTNGDLIIYLSTDHNLMDTSLIPIIREAIHRSKLC